MVISPGARSPKIPATSTATSIPPDSDGMQSLARPSSLYPRSPSSSSSSPNPHPQNRLSATPPMPPLSPAPVQSHANPVPQSFSFHDHECDVILSSSTHESLATHTPCTTNATTACSTQDPPVLSTQQKAATLLNTIEKSPMRPSSLDETWYGVDGQFIRALESITRRAASDDAVVPEKGTSPTELPSTTPASPTGHRLPCIRNQPYINPYQLRQGVTERTLLKLSRISDLTFVDAPTWNYLAANVHYDFSIPRYVCYQEDTSTSLPSEPPHDASPSSASSGRRVSPASDTLLSVERQPLTVWLIVCDSNYPYAFNGLQGTPVPFYFSVRDSVDALLKIAIRASKQESVRLFKAESATPPDVAPRQDSHVGPWEEISPHSQMTLGQLHLPGAFVGLVVHVVDARVMVPSNSAAPYSNERPQQDATKSKWTHPSNHRRIDAYTAGAPEFMITKVVGLQNLGNTCFMNSALQCLMHTTSLTRYFLSNAYKHDLNTVNPLGTRGRLATAYAGLLHDLWDPQRRNNIISPRDLKLVIGQYAPQFTGYQQQDSQELLAFLLDGLHEDLNRILHKPYLENIESGDTIDNFRLAQECWNRYKKRNDSFIVDTFQGLYRSRLQCPVCNKVSITFDPFMYLSLPLPTSVDIPIIVTFVPFGSDLQPGRKFTALAQLGCVVHMGATLHDIKLKIAQHILAYRQKNLPHATDQELTEERVCNRLMLLRCRKHKLVDPRAALHFLKATDDVTGFARPRRDVYSHRSDTIEELYAFLVDDARFVQLAESSDPFDETPSCSSTLSPPFPASSTPAIPLLKPEKSSLVSPHASYPANNPCEPAPTASPQTPSGDSRSGAALVIVVHCSPGTPGDCTTSPSSHFPVLHTLSKPLSIRCSDMYRYVEESVPCNRGTSVNTPTGFHHQHDVHTSTDIQNPHPSSTANTSPPRLTLYFWFEGPNGDRERTRCACPNSSKIYLHQAVGKPFTKLVLYAEWEPNSFFSPLAIPTEQLDNSVQDVLQLQHAPRTTHPVSLEMCLHEFLKEERLGPDNMWYCNRCKSHQQAMKKMDIWTVPDILVIHLKRFHHVSRHYRSKNSVQVLFDPNTSLDLSPFVQHGPQRSFERQINDAETPKKTPSPLLYTLYAVSKHSGGLSMGHYTSTVKCYVFDKETNTFQWKWHDFSDTFVSQCEDLSQINNPDAYLLFFQRQTSSATSTPEAL